MRVLGYLAVCCLAVVALAMPAHAIERAASLPYVYEITKNFPTCEPDEVLTTNASGVLKCVQLPGVTEIPKCTLTQYLGGGTGGKLTCKTISAVCEPGQVLQKIDADTSTCVSVVSAAPQCGAQEVLQGDDKSTLSCVKIGAAALPKCGAGTVLKNEAGTVKCVDVVNLAPKCGAEQVLQGDGGTTLSCVNIGAAALPKCAAGEVLTNLGGAVQCVDTVKGHFPTTCGVGKALTVENDAFACTTFSTGTACAAGTMALLNKGVTYCVATDCTEDQRLTLVDGKPICKALPTQTLTLPTCTGESWIYDYFRPERGNVYNPSEAVKREVASYYRINRTATYKISDVLHVAFSGTGMGCFAGGSASYICTPSTGWESIAVNCTPLDPK